GMRFDFKLIPQKDLENLIKSVLEKTGKEYEDEAVAAIARAGAGSARDSLSIADMCASYASGKLTYNDVNTVLGSADFASVSHVCESLLKEDAAQSLSGVEEVLSTGKSVGVLVKDLLNFLNWCAIVKICKNAREIVNLPDESYSRIKEVAANCDGHKILRVTEILSKAEADLRYLLSPRITMETAILKCAMPQADYNLDALIGKINELENKLSSGASVQTVKVEKAHTEKPVPTVKPVLEEKEEDVSPFSAPKPTEVVQPAMWDTEAAKLTKGAARLLGEDEKSGVFGKFIRSLRTTRKNAVLFTLCMDLNSFFEGDKLILTTDSEAVLKGLTRADNAAFLSDTLAELGVAEHEVRLVKKGESEYEKAVAQLKGNFDGTDIEIK
ncbi:MAG: hypothetical protein K2N33_02240, partial [Clostridia bacterium]|nr:hypothetical protein [Clostridia bacterium]